MKVNKLAVSLILIITLFIVGVTALALNLSKTAAVETSNNIYIKADKVKHDWGTIGINNGKVSANFEIKNTGKEILKLYNVTTSCTCTTAKLIVNDNKSPTYTMHTKSDYILEVKPNGTAQLEVIYDPAFHGPSGVGQITRTATVMTNSSSQPSLTFSVAANVTK